MSVIITVADSDDPYLPTTSCIGSYWITAARS